MSAIEEFDSESSDILDARNSFISSSVISSGFLFNEFKEFTIIEKIHL